MTTRTAAGPITIAVTAANGVPFNVRYLPAGSAYGRDGVMTAGRPLVEFYDARHLGFDLDMTGGVPSGQFVSRYHADALLGRGDRGGQAEEGLPHGLDLRGGEPSWSLDASTTADLLDWLMGQVAADGARAFLAAAQRTDPA